MREVASYTDYFVVCTARNPRNAQAIAEELRLAMKERHGVPARRIDGQREAHWILMDYLDVIVHIFTPDTRSYYDLDRLWGQVPQERLAS
jgi:ribosome-associated protein